MGKKLKGTTKLSNTTHPRAEGTTETQEEMVQLQVTESHSNPGPCPHSSLAHPVTQAVGQAAGQGLGAPFPRQRRQGDGWSDPVLQGKYFR